MTIMKTIASNPLPCRFGSGGATGALDAKSFEQQIQYNAICPRD
jgi:hypothetical protein